MGSTNSKDISPPIPAYRPPGIALVGGNRRDQNGNWIVPLTLNVPIINQPPSPPPVTPMELAPPTIGQDGVKHIEGPNYMKVPPSRQPQMRLDPSLAPLRDVDATEGAVEAASRRAESRRVADLRSGTFRENRLSAAQRQRREVQTFDTDQHRRELVESGLVPAYEEYEKDTEDESDSAESRDPRKQRLRADEERRLRLNGIETHIYTDTTRGVWRPRTANEAGRRIAPEGERSSFPQDERPNSNKAERLNSNEAESRDSNEANRRDSDEGERRNSLQPNERDADEALKSSYGVTRRRNPDFARLVHQHQAAKSKKEKQAAQSQAGEDGATNAP